jgi:hypothetical protein
LFYVDISFSAGLVNVASLGFLPGAAGFFASLLTARMGYPMRAMAEQGSWFVGC